MAPAAVAQQDLRSPGHARRRASPRTAVDRPTEAQTFPGPAQELRELTPPWPAQDLRTPDTRDAAAGRGMDTAPVVEFVEVPRTVGGFDWADAGLGAAAAIGLVLIGAGCVLTAARIRRPPSAA